MAVVDRSGKVEPPRARDQRLAEHAGLLGGKSMAKNRRIAVQQGRSTARRRGRHRAPAHLDTNVWLGASALTLGLGAAALSGAGVAYADDGASEGASPKTSSATSSSSSTSETPSTHQQPSRGGDSPGLIHKGGVPKTVSKQVNSRSSASSGTDDDEASPEKQSVKAVSDPPQHSNSLQTSTTPASADPDTAVSGSYHSPSSSSDVPAFEDALTPEPPPEATTGVSAVGNASKPEVDTITGGQTPSPVTPPVSVAAPAFVSTLSAVAAPGDVAGQPLQLASKTTTAAAAPTGTVMTEEDIAALAAWTAAHAAEIRSLDPNDRFVTPISPDNPINVAGVTVIIPLSEAVELLGSAGFTRDSANNLVYRNSTNDDVLLAYGNESVSRVVPAGLALIHAGQSYTVPGGSGAMATVQAPRVTQGITNVIAVGGPGFPASSGSGGGGASTGPTPTYASGSRFITAFNALLTSPSYHTLVDNIGFFAGVLGLHQVGHFANAVSSFLFGYKQDYVGLALHSFQEISTGVMAAAAKSHNPLLYLAGAAVNSWSYAANLAVETDWSNPGETFSYAASHPVETIVETGKAAAQVAGHFVGTVMTSLGGLLKLF